MKLGIGYQSPSMQTHKLTEIVSRYLEHVDEVYFAWIEEPSGRMPIGLDDDLPLPVLQQMMEKDLVDFRKMGIGLNLLFNASCYGEWAASESLAMKVCHTIDYLNQTYGIKAITTTSPFIASLVKEHFPDIQTRASVNMRIGTIKGAEYVAPLFDGFYITRDHNRDLNQLQAFKSWCDQQGKSMYLLANSGCLPHCSGQSFHDNLVSHESKASQIKGYGFDPSICRHFYADPKHWVRILQSTWIRPEDLHHYEPFTKRVKLATRMHDNPELVIKAYANASHDGNLLDLLEPSHAMLLQDYIIDNTAFPDDWFEMTTTCHKECHSGCDYCQNVLDQVLKRREES